MTKEINFTVADVEGLIQSSGEDCIEEFVDGILIDNILFYDRFLPSGFQYVAAIETPMNTWRSNYTVYFGNSEEIYGLWNGLFDIEEPEELVS